VYNVGHNEAIAIEMFKEKLYEKSNGRIKLTIYGSSQLGSEREISEQVVLGTCDMGSSDGPTWSNATRIPELAVWGLPFLYEDIDAQKRVINEIYLKEGEKMMIPGGIRPIYGASSSIRGSLLVKKPIVKADDIIGLKMRVPEITMYVDTWKALGANSVTTPWSESYTALMQGVCDGVEVDPSAIVDANLHEVGKYFSRTAHMGTLHFVVMNEKKWQSIPKDLQQIILECGAEVSEWQIEDRKRADLECEQKMKDAGVIFNDISPEERAKMIERVKPLYERYEKEYGLGDLIRKIQEISAKK
jgi:tripartite ATP-independent transporter DctP family solute receptor